MCPSRGTALAIDASVSDNSELYEGRELRTVMMGICYIAHQTFAELSPGLKEKRLVTQRYQLG
ncbi:hypothetical protein Q9Y_01611 [Enterococcus faecalis EnGen0081]|uniref:hypothetical protein n=1 Tax=Enterococcus faecalis TaxID=1351 RepID=UPI00032E68A0|nr:hypothetical protein [Enterococcus faecalis]EOE22849.1 hypothetical protein Q9Y_01611 [Enterococcus faecalis EnGen0081]